MESIRGFFSWLNLTIGRCIFSMTSYPKCSMGWEYLRHFPTNVATNMTVLWVNNPYIQRISDKMITYTLEN